MMELMEASLLDVMQEPSFSAYATWDAAFISVAADVSQGMAYLHYHDVLHRDLKPANILLDAQWVAKVADFGTALTSKVLADDAVLPGTPMYMAPEVCRREASDKPIDIWSFGCVLVHMGARAPPYSTVDLKGKTPKQLIDMIGSGSVLPYDGLLKKANGTPDAVVELAKSCCGASPEQRPPSFESITEKLEEIIGGAEPRPIARIRGKRIIQTRLSESAAAAVESAPKRSPLVYANANYDKSYRDKSNSARNHVDLDATLNVGVELLSTFVKQETPSASAPAPEQPELPPPGDPVAPAPAPDAAEEEPPVNFFESFLATFSPPKPHRTDTFTNSNQFV